MRNVTQLLSVLAIGFFLLTSSFSNPVRFGEHHTASHRVIDSDNQAAASVAAFAGAYCAVLGAVWVSYLVGTELGKDAYNAFGGGATVEQLTFERYDANDFSKFDYVN